MGKTRKKIGIGKSLIIILVAILALIIGSHVIRAIKEERVEKITNAGFSLTDAKEYQSEWENTPSDIYGMSLWDKYSMGLAVNVGSDTDGDGLTDQEEIEIYGSDPLKISTAGDLYTDYYKAQNGYDLKEYREYDQPVEFPCNHCPEVSLTANCPSDFNAVVETPATNSQLGGGKVYAQYLIYNYSGKLTIDLNNALSNTTLTADDLIAYINDGKELKRCSFTTDGNVVTLKKALEANLSYEIFFIEDEISNRLSILFGGSNAIQKVEDEDVSGIGLVYCSPLLVELSKKPLEIFYQDLYNEDSNAILKDKVLGGVKATFSDADRYYSEDSIKAASYLSVRAKYEFLNNLLPSFQINSNSDAKWYHIFFTYYLYDSNNTEDQMAEDPNADVTTESHFQISSDTLPFGNFRSSIGENGNCAGISHFTAKLYNTGTYDGSGKFDSIIWSITEHADNATLLDRGLSDYKDTTFVSDHSSEGNLLNKDLSADEQQFVNMIGAAYLQGNKIVNKLYQDVYGGENGSGNRDYQLIEKMKEILNDGKILDVYLRMVDDSGHAINIYGYENDPTNTNITRFFVYDSNYPGTTNLVMEVTKKLKAIGSGYTFDFSYYPTSDRSYGSTSNPLITSAPLMLVLNENWEDINPVNPEITLRPTNPENEDFSATKCIDCHYNIHINNYGRAIVIQCTFCGHQPNPTDVDATFIKKWDFGLHTDEELRIILAMYKAQDIGPGMLTLLNTLANTDKIGMKWSWFAWRKDTDNKRVTAQIKTGLEHFKDTFDTGYALAEEDELILSMDQKEFMAHFVGDTPSAVIDVGSKLEDIVDQLQATVSLIDLGIALKDSNNDYSIPQYRKLTGKLINTVNHLIDIMPDETLMSAYYGAQLEALKTACNDYFDSCENYQNLMYIYDEHLDSELEKVFTAEQMDEFVKPFSGNRDQKTYWGRNDMPTLEEVLDTVYTKDQSSTTLLERLSPKSQLLVMEYIEFRIHHEFEEATGITLECYYDLARPENNIFGKPEKFLWFNPWSKEPWEKGINPDKYVQFGSK